MSKTATEVLEEIKLMVERLTQASNNQDFLYKTLYNKIIEIDEKIDTVLSKIGNTNTSNITNAPQPMKSIMPGIKPGVFLNKSQENKTSQNFTSPPLEETQHTSVFSEKDEEDFKEWKQEALEEPSEMIGKRRDARHIPIDTTKRLIPVQQKLLLPDGKVLSVASVEIFDTDLNFVKAIKTSVAGKWTNALYPGSYILKIGKKGTATRSEIDEEINITITNSEEPIQLPPYVIGSKNEEY